MCMYIYYILYIYISLYVMMTTIVIGKVSPRVRSQSPAQQHLFRRNVSDFELGKSSLGKVAADIQLGEMNLRKV